MRAMRLPLAAALLIAGTVATVRAEVSPRFTFQLRAVHPGPGPFGEAQRVQGDAVRLFPGDTLELGISGHLHDASLPDFDNAHLIPQLSWCLLPDTTYEAEVMTGAPLRCLPFDASPISVTAINDGLAHLRASVTASSVSLPTGTHALLAVISNPALTALLGGRATIETRSSPVRVTLGAAENLDEALSQLYWQAKRQDLDENWNGVLSSTTSLLEQYGNSVLALQLKAGARVELGNLTAAKATYLAALQILQADQDTRTPLFADAEMKEMYMQSLQRSIDALP
jgi:hypothetical protein